MIFCGQRSLYDPLPLLPVRPRVLQKHEWANKDYRAFYAWRVEQLQLFKTDPLALAGARAYYSKPENWHEFVMDWFDTYDPRRDELKWMPFVMFDKQKDFFSFLLSCYNSEENGLVEKARDMGATWICCAFTICVWLFVKDAAIGWGSRKEELVDRLGDVSSIFEKLRQIVARLPDEFRPSGFDPKRHATFMKLINPSNGATVTGESGDNIGRGGRTKIYFKDESAHYERPELIEAALGDNTRVQIDISSVNGLGNPFHKRREAGIEWPETKKGFTRVFVMDYSDHPEKTAEWYEMRRAKYEREGMLHIFAQEVERNYSAAVSGTIIPMEWIIAARDAHLHIEGMRGGKRHGGFDVADEGGDMNAIADIDGVVLDFSEEWGSRDPGVAARKVIAHFKQYKNAVVFYDNIALGAAVKSEINRLTIEEKIKDLPEFIGWNAGGKVNWPKEHVIPDDEESEINVNFFGNFKAQAWWSLRNRFLRTWQARTQGVVHPPDTLISLNTQNPLIRKLEKELAQPVMSHNGRLQMIIDKKPEGTKSPNLADAAVMGYFPPDELNFNVSGLIGR